MRRRCFRALTIGLLGWASCSVYDESLLTGASGGTAGSSGVGGATGGAGGAGGKGSGGNGGDAMGGSAGNAGSSTTGGSSGSGSAGKGGAGGGGAGKGSGGTGGSGGSNSGGKGGSSGGGPGMAGEAGDGGCPMGDCCPADDTKSEPGECGCGVPDTDTDGDDTPDCTDQCQDDVAKTSPGECGCGAAEASCLPLKNSLLHRYSFDGTGTTVTDSKGTAHGTAMGTGIMLSGTGKLTLAGGFMPSAMDPNKHYVALPPGCLDGLTNATFEAWFDWAPAADTASAQSFWQRIFDFGEPAAAGVGTYIWASPRATSTTGPSRVSFTQSMGSSGQIFATGAMLAAGRFHFTIVVDDTNDLLSLYVDGVLQSSIAFPGALSAINDSNCNLGRSQFPLDPYFAGTLDEFRIHGAAFSAQDVTFSHTSGPDPTFL